MKKIEKGFSLIEVLAAVTILAGVLFSVSRIISASYLYASMVSNIYLGTELAQLKMHEIEEILKEDGIPETEFEDRGTFDNPEYDAFRWEYTIRRVFFPLPDLSPGRDDVGGYQDQAAGMLSLARGNIEDFFRDRIRKLTLTVSWGSGKRASEKVVFTYFLTTTGRAGEFRQHEGKKQETAPSGEPGSLGVPPGRLQQQRPGTVPGRR